ncbi:DUF2007-related protein [Mediterranea massiliensis]|jgi:hypothetical protein|uniref:DUF2007-related protein n=1 Tax=Mediterranea massiliensis TaxID=1841865 RepID=UPI0025A3C1C2|nr:DUF2007-related protein [Mediterranea massiliensis]MDM8336857.1 DUF2007-related protein [Mediterranea massiliensis]
MKEDDKTKTVEVFKGAPWKAELVKGQLQSNGISAMTKDGLMSSIAPYIVADVTVLVLEKDYEAAMSIIREQAEKENAE